MNTYETKIKKFLESETQKAVPDTKTNLIEKGILDSFSMIKLIGFIERELGILGKMEELTPENFNSVENITQMIERWKSGK